MGLNEQLKEEIVKILLDTIEENVKLIRGGRIQHILMLLYLPV